jgi:hypothetical protein
MSSSPSPKPQASSFVWYELHTPDLSTAASFYSAVLGWTAQDSGLSDRRYTIVSVNNIAVAGLLEKSAATFNTDAKPGWVGYIGTADLSQSVQRLEASGGSVLRAPETMPNVGSFAVVADPQGAMFVLFQPPDARQQPPRPAPGTPGSPAWHDLVALDWESDFDFYARMFAWSKAEAVPMGSAGVYQLFADGSGPIGGMMTRMDPSQRPGWLFYFNVEEINATVRRVTDNGGKILHGPSPVPGGQQIAHCLDAQGAIFGIVGPKA